MGKYLLLIFHAGQDMNLLATPFSISVILQKFCANGLCFVKIECVLKSVIQFRKRTHSNWLKIIIFSTAVDHLQRIGRVENVLIVKRRGQEIFSCACVS